MLISMLVVGGAVAVAVKLARRDAASGIEPPIDRRSTPSRRAGATAGGDESEAAAAEASEAADAVDAASPPEPPVLGLTPERGLAASAGALGLQAVGAATGTALGVVSVVPLGWMVAAFVRASYLRRRKGDGSWVPVLDTVYLGGSLLTGHIVACAAGGALVFGSMKLLERTRRRTRSELTRAFGELPERAWLVLPEATVEVDVARIVAGDRVRVQAGQRMPIDGVVDVGVGAVDERALTGESIPASKSPGDPVMAATLVVEGPLIIRATGPGSDSTVGRLQRILARTDDLTERYRGRGQRIVEGGAGPTLALSALSLPLVGPAGALAVSCVAFGYQMRFAGPLSALRFVGSAAQGGVLVKDARALELLGQVDTVVFDKTGTLTTDAPTVVAVCPVAGYSAADVLALAAAAEQGQGHPLAVAILAAAAGEGVVFGDAEQVEVVPGRGLKARLDGRRVRVGSAPLMLDEGLILPHGLAAPVPGSSAVYVAADGAVVGRFDIATPARQESRRVVRALRERGIDVVLLSGDRRDAVTRFADEVGISEVHAEVDPEGKAAIIAELRRAGRRVCFVGDGINDTIALKAAEVSVSLAGATMAAVDTAAIVLLDGHLERLPDLFRLADDFDRAIKRGVWLSIAPGVLCVGGVYLVHLGIAGALTLYYASLAGSMGNALVSGRPPEQVTDEA